MIAITGLGPRTGTSFLMRQCMLAGLPVHFDPTLEAMLPAEGNPTGYWEINPVDLPQATGIAKVWPVYLPLASIDKMVVLRRGLTSQLASIRQQAYREAHLVDEVPAQCYIEAAYSSFLEWLPSSEAEIRIYDTETLSSNLNEILSFLGD